MAIVDHFLHAEIIVPVDKKDAFEAASENFLAAGAFDRFSEVRGQYRFVLGMRTVEDFPYHAYGRFAAPLNTDDFARADSANVFRDGLLAQTQRVYRYVHMWAVPNLIGLDLDRTMRACVDDPHYMAIDEQVIREVQNFVRLVHQPGYPAPVLPGAHEFVRVVRRLNGADLPHYLFQFGAELPVWESKGWHSVGQYQNITGLLNVATEIWQTDADKLPALRVPDPRQLRPGMVYPSGVAELREHYRRTEYFTRHGVTVRQ